MKDRKTFSKTIMCQHGTQTKTDASADGLDFLLSGESIAKRSRSGGEADATSD